MSIYVQVCINQKEKKVKLIFTNPVKYIKFKNYLDIYSTCHKSMYTKQNSNTSFTSPISPPSLTYTFLLFCTSFVYSLPLFSPRTVQHFHFTISVFSISIRKWSFITPLSTSVMLCSSRNSSRSGQSMSTCFIV